MYDTKVQIDQSGNARGRWWLDTLRTGLFRLHTQVQGAQLS